MFDASLEFEKFIKERIVLPFEDQQKLRKNKDTNIQRLKNGLSIYNHDHKTDYMFSEIFVQGSMSMSTVIQNDANDYDIDVAIVFDEETINGLSAYQARKMVLDALSYKTGQFKNDPELKTNCVRISYADGYHIDFAVYRKIKKPFSNDYQYQHSGGFNWTDRDPKAITAWFQSAVKQKGQKLRKVVRLLKTFCKSRNDWVNMPGGLIQSVLCEEAIDSLDKRIDEIFYNAISCIIKRLKIYKDVRNPTDAKLSLLSTQRHFEKMDNLLARLEEKIGKLNILFDQHCTSKDAYQAWYNFFNNNYWLEQKTSLTESLIKHSYAKDKKIPFADTEEEIIDFVDRINIQYDAYIEAKVESRGFPSQGLYAFLSSFPIFRKFLPKGMKLDFYATTNAPKPYEVWWKVRNVGRVAEERNDIRGQILKKFGAHKREDSVFPGPHYVECYIIKNGECVAQAHLDVHIGDQAV